ncbi:MAG TPA: divergent polysaccharide deacetylase family protein [Methylomirabilota bacterium]|nr:divergent polysaccharide deacetylase family protein [Methylomirabilota bacterium]
MEAKLWRVLIGLTLLVGFLVVGLDRWQARRGEASVFTLFWSPASKRDSGQAASRAKTLPSRRETVTEKSGARLAIIIDDLGYRQDLFDALKEFRRPLTLAVLPDLPLSKKIAAEAPGLGMEVLLHLPMEPYRYPEVDPGSGALLMSMPPQQLETLTRKYLAQLPTVVGINTHMGSRMTESRGRMRAVLAALSEKRLLFVDSLTTNMSVAYDEAKALGIRAARRQVFLDPEFDETSERRQFEDVTRRAARGKDTIVIGHGHPMTLRLLHEYLPKWEAMGVRVVPVSQLAS